MVTLLYILITGLMLVLVVWNLYREADGWKQLTAAMVMVPLLLRLLGIK